MNVCDTLSLTFAVNPMENPVGSWIVAALKTEREELQTSLEISDRRKEGHRGPHLHSTAEQQRRTLKGQRQGTPRGGGTSPGPRKAVLPGGSRGPCQTPKEGHIR